MTAKLGGESAGEAATAHIPDGRYSHFEASTSPYVDRSHELDFLYTLHEERQHRLGHIAASGRRPRRGKREDKNVGSYTCGL